MNKKKIIKRIFCTTCAVLLFALGFIGVFNNDKTNVVSAYADELVISTYESGAIMVNPNLLHSTTTNGVIHNYQFLSVETFDTRFTFTVDTNNNFRLRYYMILNDGTVIDLFDTSTANINAVTSWNENFSKVCYINGGYMNTIQRTFYGLSQYDGGIGVNENVLSYPSAKLNYAEFYFNENVALKDIYKVEYYSGKTNPNYLNSNFLYINFYDLDNRPLFRFAVQCGVVSDTLIRYMNSNSNGSYEEGYQEGYNADKRLITEKAYQDGYDDGTRLLNQSIDEAFRNGFLRGQENASTSSDVTIKDMLLGVAEVPFTTVKSFLNFDLLGYNISHLVTGLLSGLLIVKIIMLMV